MKIAIFGSRGIPNSYGGFEQYAELLSVYLAKEGWEVVVYNSSAHPYTEQEYEGVKIKHIYNPENKIGAMGGFIYDLGCILHTRKEKFDLIYQLGYTSSAIFNFLLPRRHSKVITNMDGMEWKRTKYNKPVRLLLKYSERIVARKSDFLIADSMAIHAYISRKYKTHVFYSAYTALVPEQFNPVVLEPFRLKPKQYFLIIARLEPENNIQMIIEGYLQSGHQYPLVIIGRTNTKFGKILLKKYVRPEIIFIGAFYDKQMLNSLRHFSCLYLHGHSVGGTNPSLLEAMACSCGILAHENEFNKAVLGENALYFKDETEISAVLQLASVYPFKEMIARNLKSVATQYSESAVFLKLKNKMMEWVQKRN